MSHKENDYELRKSDTSAIAGTDLDELLVGDWLHIEQMDKRHWWMSVGGCNFNVFLTKKGKVKAIYRDDIGRIWENKK